MVTTDNKSIRFPFELISNQLEEVEHEIRAQAKAFDPAVENYVSYVCNTSGKRIRPALALLTGGAVGSVDEKHVKLGVILEMIHIASLVHDDIIDGADMRRELPTASAKWGNALSVLLGDCLFAHALTEATSFDDTLVSRKIGLSSSAVCAGEIMQTQRRFDLNLTKEAYFEIIEKKTAALFGTACELAAYFSGGNETLQASLLNYGLKLGSAYQIYDDCIDLMGDEEIIGKTLGTDLAKGKFTLPLLNLLEKATDSQKAKLNKILLQNEPIEISVLAGIADYEGSIEESVDTAKSMLEEARSELVGLQDNDYTGALVTITQFVDGLLDKCRT